MRVFWTRLVLRLRRKRRLLSVSRLAGRKLLGQEAGTREWWGGLAIVLAGRKRSSGLFLLSKASVGLLNLVCLCLCIHLSEVGFLININSDVITNIYTCLSVVPGSGPCILLVHEIGGI